MTTRGEINSNFYQIVNVDANGTPTSIKSQYVPTANSANTANYANFAGNANIANTANVANSVSVANVVGIGNIATLNLTGSNSNVLYGNGVFAQVGNGNYATNANYANFAGNAFNVSGSNVSGAVNLATYATTANSVAGGNVSGAVNLANYATVANSVSGSNVSGYVANATHSNVSDSANSVNVANVVGIGNIATTNYNGNGSQVLAGNGAWVAQSGGSSNLIYNGNSNVSIPSIDGNVYINANASIDNQWIFNIDGNLTLPSGGVLGNPYGDSGNQSQLQAGLNGYAGINNSDKKQYVVVDDNGAYIGTDYGVSSNQWTFDKTGNSVFPNIGTANLGNLAIANFFQGNGSLLTDVANANYATYSGEAFFVAGGNVDGQVANANYSVFSGTSFSVDGANVSGVVANANYSAYSGIAYSVDGANVSGEVANANYATYSGTSFSVDGANVSGIVANANYSDYSGTSFSVDGANVSGQVSNALIAGTVYDNAQPNITSLGTLTTLTSTGNITAPYFLGNVVGNISGNIVVPGLQWNVLYNDLGNAGASNNFLFNATTNTAVVTGNLSATYLLGNGAFITGLPASYGNAQVANYLPTFTGNLSAGNANLGNLVTANFFSGNGSLLTNITSTTGNANYANFAGNAFNVSGANVSGAVANANYATYAGTAYSVSGGNVVGTVANANYSLYAGQAFSVTGGNVSGQVANANYSVYSGVAFSVDGANVSGQVSNALIAGTVYTNAQPNITSVGTLTELNVEGNISGNYFIGNGSALTGITTSYSANANYANYAGNAFSVSGSNVSGAVAYATTANSVAGSNVSGQVSNALIAGTVYTNAQPNITSVGILSSLSVTGNISSGNANLGNLATANFFTGNGYLLTGITVTSTANANYANYAGNAFSVNASNIVGTVNLANYATVANSVAGANVSGQVSNALVAGTVYTNAQPNITSVGQLTGLEVTSGSLTANTPVNLNQTWNNGSATFIGLRFNTSNSASGTNSKLLDLQVNTVSQFSVFSNGNANATGNIAASYFIGNGSALTGITASPAGANTQVQFNDGGSFGGNTGLTFNKTSGNLSIGGNTIFGANVYSNVTGLNANYNFFTPVGNALAINIGQSYTTIPSLIANTILQASNISPSTGGNINLSANIVNIKPSGASDAILTFVPTSIGSSLIGNIYWNTSSNAFTITSASNITLSPTSNLNLGAIGNVKITGGSSGQVISTDGTGNLSFVAQSGGSSATDFTPSFMLGGM